MTDSDLNRIETELGIRLPFAYRQLVCPYPIATYVGNGEVLAMSLWDSASELIQLNLELRQGYLCGLPWPHHYFALGRDGTGSAELIDLNDVECRVIRADKCNIQSTEGARENSPCLKEWADQYLEEVRTDLFERGIDESTPPVDRQLKEDLDAKAGCRTVLFWIGGSFLIALLIRGCSQLL